MKTRIAHTISSSLSLSGRIRLISHGRQLDDAADIRQTLTEIHETSGPERASALGHLCDRALRDRKYREAAVASGAIGELLELRKRTEPVNSPSHRYSLPLKTLSVLGHHDAPLSRKRRGLRILSLDGGGTRALVTINILKDIQRRTGKQMHELFDLICGVSTGSILAFFLGIKHRSLDECEDMFTRLCAKVFYQIPVLTTAKLLIKGSYYDPTPLEDIFKTEFGMAPMIETAADPKATRVFAVATSVAQRSPSVFLFRNYNYPIGHRSLYQGTCTSPLWEALRCSTAAPSYFPPYRLGNQLLSDGGLIANNPTAIAVHEARRIWPATPIECVLAVGTGQADPNMSTKTGDALGWVDLAKTLIESATATETIHTALQDLLAPGTYFRFNPILPGAAVLDEYRPHELSAYRLIGRRFTDAHAAEMGRLCDVLSGNHLSWTQKLLPPIRLGETMQKYPGHMSEQLDRVAEVLRSRLLRTKSTPSP